MERDEVSNYNSALILTIDIHFNKPFKNLVKTSGHSKILKSNTKYKAGVSKSTNILI